MNALVTRAPIPVLVDPSQFPEAVLVQLAADLRVGRLPAKFHYLSWRQARAWLDLHRRYAPFFAAPDGVRLYDVAAAWALDRLGGEPVVVVSLGCGAGQKDRLVLRRLMTRPASYVPVDAGLDLLLTAAGGAARVLGGAAIQPHLVDLAAIDDWLVALTSIDGECGVRLVLCYGLLPTLGGDVLRRMRTLLRPSDFLLLSANLTPRMKPGLAARGILPQYDNAETRGWLSMGLEDIGLAPGQGEWRFDVVGDDSSSESVEAWFMPDCDTTLSVGEASVEMRAGNPLRVFCSHRFDERGIEEVASAHGLRIVERWISEHRDEGVFLCTLGGR